MTNITIQLDDDVARYVEETARRERRSISEWVAEWLRPVSQQAQRLQALEAVALANGYPAGWITLFGSLADDESSMAPERLSCRPVAVLEP